MIKQNVVIKQSCHPELVSGSTPLVAIQNKEEILKRVQHDNRRGGFTLIELLVVVLIISILAAVAVPQYKKAVLKSRFSSLYPIAQPLAQGQESYYLNQGEYAEDLAALDVSVPGNPSGKTTTLQDGTQVKLGVEDNHIYVRASKGNNALMIYQNHSPNFAGETHCEAKLDDDFANWLCDKGLQGTFVGNKYGYAIYSLSEETVGTLARNYYNATNFTATDGDACVATERSGCSAGSGNNKVASGGKCIADEGGEWGCWNIPVTDGECIANAKSGCFAGTYNNSTCTANAEGGCTGGATRTNHSSCKGNAFLGCGGTFLDYSTCDGNAGHSCRNGNFKNHSVCYGNAVQSCFVDGSKGSSIFEEYSSCVGEKNYTCYRLTFKNHSYCQANKTGACTGNTYDETSYCTGNYCPDGAPSNTAGKVWYRGTGSEWPDTRESELVDKQ